MRTLLLTLTVLLASCSLYQDPAPVRGGMTTPAVKPHIARPDFYRIPEQVQCVPYARETSGIQIRGDAHTWWHQAPSAGYARGHKPQKGAVLVLSKTSRLKYGHVAVVKKIIDGRTIEVAHSNWGGNMRDRCVVYNAMPVKDVSANNDWSKLRFWHYPSSTFGSVYPASGFIYPK